MSLKVRIELYPPPLPHGKGFSKLLFFFFWIYFFILVLEPLIVGKNIIIEIKKRMNYWFYVYEFFGQNHSTRHSIYYFIISYYVQSCKLI